ncbi:MAG TPA: histidine kinase [Flavobacteriales bacterium]|nr:histidine kinase [Flavobacteriales bacterium]
MLLLLALRCALAQSAVDRMKDLRARSSFDSLEVLVTFVLDDGASPEGLRYEAEHHWAFARSGKDDPAGALAHGQAALRIARQLSDTVRIMGSLYQLVKFNVEARHYDEADRLRYELLSLAERFGKDPRQLALAHNAMGSMHSRELRHDSAEHHYRKGLQALDAADEPLVRVALLGNLAGTLGETGRHEEAIALHRQALALVGPEDPPNRAWTLRTLAQSLIHAGRFTEAVAAMNEGDSLNRLSGNALDLAIDFAELRADALDSLGDIRGAYAMVRLARDLQDTLFERSLNEQYIELEKRFETQLKEEEIQRLDAEAREREERLRVRNVQLYGSLALVALAIGGIVLVWRNLRQKRLHAAVLEGLNVELKDQKARIEEINRLLQLKVLRAQINPHFIYNCLHAISNLVRKDDMVAASNYLDGFARLLRMVLDHSVKDRVPLSQEMDFLRQYLKLEALRFPDGLAYVVDAEPALLDEDDAVPALVVQPFVENAIWHGLATKEGAKKVSVRFAEQNGRITCTVEDNGVGREAAPKRAHTDGSPSMGLQLTNERLQLLTYRLQERGSVTFTDLHEGGMPSGTRVEVVLG